jgi:peptide deformylase
MLLKILTVGDPILRAVSRTLSKKELLGAPIQNLIDYMRETVRDAPGVGLAAPQIGESIQLAVIEDRPEYFKGLSAPELKERDRFAVPFHVIVNPVLTLLEGPSETFFEGCLSLPGYTARVPRSKNLRVACLDHRGESQTIEASGWYARILQHEIDHLQGNLYIDQMQTRSFSSIVNQTRHSKE